MIISQYQKLSELQKEMQKRSRQVLSGKAKLIDGEDFFAEMDKKYGLTSFKHEGSGATPSPPEPQ